MSEIYCNVRIENFDPDQYYNIGSLYSHIKGIILGGNTNIKRVKYAISVEDAKTWPPYGPIPTYFYCYECSQYTDDPDQKIYHLENCPGVNELLLTKKGKTEFEDIIKQRKLEGKQIMYSDLYRKGGRVVVPSTHNFPVRSRNMLQITYEYRGKCVNVNISFYRQRNNVKLNMFSVPYKFHGDFIEEFCETIFGVVNKDKIEIGSFFKVIKFDNPINVDEFKGILDTFTDFTIMRLTRYNITIRSKTEEGMNTAIDAIKSQVDLFIDPDIKEIIKRDYTPKKCHNRKPKTKTPDILRPIPYSFWNSEAPTRFTVIRREGMVTKDNEYEPCSEKMKISKDDTFGMLLMPNDRLEKLTSSKLTTEFDKKEFDDKLKKKKITNFEHRTIRRIVYGFPNDEYDEDKADVNGFVDNNGTFSDPDNAIGENRSYPGLIKFEIDELKALFATYYKKISDNGIKNVVVYFRITKLEPKTKMIQLNYPGDHDKSYTINGKKVYLILRPVEFKNVKNGEVYIFNLNYYKVVDKYGEVITRLFKYKPFNLIDTVPRESRNAESIDSLGIGFPNLFDDFA